MMENSPKSSPVGRIDFMDILRGFALIGVLIGNMWWLGGYRYVPLRLLQWYRSGEIAARESAFWLTEVFVDGKFHTLFALLFGASYFYFSRKNSHLAFKRLGWLAVFGLAHSYLWSGDILLLYAIVGFVFVSLTRLISNFKALIALSLFVLFMPDLIGFVQWFYGYLQYPFKGRPLHSYDYATTYRVISEGSWQDLFTMTASLNMQKWGVYYFSSGRYLKVLALFTMGYGLAGLGYFSSQPKSLILAFILLVSGIGGNIWLVGYKKHPLVLEYLIHLTLALGYLESVRCLQNYLKWLIPFGRTAFTNYVLQTVLAIFIFYGVGLGWIVKASIYPYMGTFLLILLMQICISILWLSQFRQGPLEFAWRKLYRKTTV